ncbi:hypothetical protein GS682_05770 [Nostoc sp. B(2019)]|nr:hypothetical protein [Nostoc sp. B(2019)]
MLVCITSGLVLEINNPVFADPPQHHYRGDFCTASKEIGPYWQFSSAYVQHDYCYEEIRKDDMHRALTVSQRSRRIKTCDQKFLNSMRSHCDTRPVSQRKACRRRANVYYRTVRAYVYGTFRQFRRR